MTAVAELLHLVRKRGAEVRFGGPTAIEVIRYRLLDNATLAELRQVKPGLRRALQAELEAVAIASAQRLLRECRFPPEAAPCAYHCGRTHEHCRRCGASWHEHYPRGGAEPVS